MAGQVALQDAGPAEYFGTDVFIPGVPGAVVTNDTGSFVLREVPEGAVTLVASHDGFTPRRLDLTVSAGQLLSLAPIELARAATGQLASLRVTVRLSPEAQVQPQVTVLRSSGPVVLSRASDGVFTGELAPGRVTVLVTAEGYADAVLENVLLQPSAPLDFEVLLTRGDTHFDAGVRLDAGTPPLGCGDGAVVTPEACDDGNLRDGDGCSSLCELELQSGGGESCLDATPLRLVPTGKGTRAARAMQHGTFRGDFISACVSPPAEDSGYLLSLPEPGQLAVSTNGNVQTLLSLRPKRDCTMNEVVCGGLIDTSPLPAGDYVLALLNTQSGTLTVNVSFTPAAVTLCGNGQVDPGEECDDGNLLGYDGCSANCLLETQNPQFSCTRAPQLLLTRSGTDNRSAKFSTLVAGYVDPALTLSCAPSLVVQVFRFDLSTSSRVYASVLGPRDTALGIFSLPLGCANIQPLTCGNDGGMSVGESLDATLPAGQYLLAIGGGELNVAIGQLTVVP